MPSDNDKKILHWRSSPDLPENVNPLDFGAPEGFITVREAISKTGFSKTTIRKTKESHPREWRTINGRIRRVYVRNDFILGYCNARSRLRARPEPRSRRKKYPNRVPARFLLTLKPGEWFIRTEVERRKGTEGVYLHFVSGDDLSGLINNSFRCVYNALKAGGQYFEIRGLPEWTLTTVPLNRNIPQLELEYRYTKRERGLGHLCRIGTTDSAAIPSWMKAPGLMKGKVEREVFGGKTILRVTATQMIEMEGFEPGELVDERINDDEGKAYWGPLWDLT
jgi:hypothetical protein